MSVDDVRTLGAELRAERERWREAVRDVCEALEGRPDATVLLTERTALQLRSGRLLLARTGREPVPLDDDSVPGEILLLAARALPRLVAPAA